MQQYQMSTTDTIAAIATPHGIGGIGIVRISGPRALEIGEKLTEAKLQNNQVRFRKFSDASGQTLDHGLCFYCQAPHSFSGEDVVEIQGHGGPILLDMLLERICELGARLARRPLWSTFNCRLANRRLINPVHGWTCQCPART